MTKTDFKKTLPSYKAKHGHFEIIIVPPLQYLMLDGHGDPNAETFASAIETLYPLAYKLKFMSKQELGKDYVVPPLEALWTADNMAAYTTARDKSQWDWTLLLMTPDWITSEQFDAARTVVATKKSLTRLSEVRLETLNESKCVQTLHIGSYDDEGPVLDRMHNEFMPANKLQFAGQHHEIYLSDFRKVAPDKLRTILRQPVE